MIGLSQDSVMTPKEWDQYDRTVRNLHQLLNQIDDTIRLKRLSNPDVMNASMPSAPQMCYTPQQPVYQSQQPASYQPVQQRRQSQPASYGNTYQSSYNAPTTQIPVYRAPQPTSQQRATAPSNPLGMQLPPSQPMPEFHPTMPAYNAPTRVEPSYQSSSSSMSTPAAGRKMFGF